MNQTIESFLTDWTEAELAGDRRALDPLLTDDFVGIGPLGFALPKEAWLTRFAGGLAYQEFHLDDVQAREYDHAAIVQGDQVGRGTHGGRQLPFERIRATLTLVPDAGRWRMAGIHMSFIAGTPGAPPLPGAAPGSPSEDG